MAGYDGDYQYYIEVASDNTKVTADHTGFVFMLDLSLITDSAGFWANVASDGKDIRVTSSDGNTEYPHDLYYIDTGNELGILAWKSDADTDASQTFRIYYGNSGASAPAEDATYGRENVYMSEIKAWHWFGYDPTGGVIDRTANDNDLTHEGMASEDLLTGQGCIGGKAIDFDGTNKLKIASGSQTGLNINTSDIFYGLIMVKDSNTPAEQIPMYRQGSASNANQFCFNLGSTSWGSIINWDNYLYEADEPANSTWGMLNAFHYDSYQYTQVDATTATSATGTNFSDQPSDQSTYEYGFGIPEASNIAGRTLDGKICMAWAVQPTIATGFWDSDWADTMYNCYMDNANFWDSIGTQQDNPNSASADEASVSPIALTATLPSVTATYIAIASASVSPLQIQITPPAVTAVAAQLETASVSPVAINITPVVPTPTFDIVGSASVAPIVMELAVKVPTPTYLSDTVIPTKVTFDPLIGEVLLHTHKWHVAVTDLQEKTGGKGASMIGSQDSGDFFSATTVEGILQEIGQRLYDLENP